MQVEMLCNQHRGISRISQGGNTSCHIKDKSNLTGGKGNQLGYAIHTEGIQYFTHWGVFSKAEVFLTGIYISFQ